MSHPNGHAQRQPCIHSGVGEKSPPTPKGHPRRFQWYVPLPKQENGEGGRWVMPETATRVAYLISLFLANYFCYFCCVLVRALTLTLTLIMMPSSTGGRVTFGDFLPFVCAPRGHSCARSFSKLELEHVVIKLIILRQCVWAFVRWCTGTVLSQWAE